MAATITAMDAAAPAISEDEVAALEVGSLVAPTLEPIEPLTEPIRVRDEAISEEDIALEVGSLTAPTFQSLTTVQSIPAPPSAASSVAAMTASVVSDGANTAVANEFVEVLLDESLGPENFEVVRPENY